MSIRSPAVAGAFYPFSKEEALGQLEALFQYWGIGIESLGDDSCAGCKGLVVPHAGWAYSGYVAAKAYAELPSVDTIILMGPNHYGVGPDFSVSSSDWATPLGRVNTDKGLVEAICNSSIAEADDLAHQKEHSIEVQLPFLQLALNRFEIVPISIKNYAADEAFLSVCKDFGRDLASCINDCGKKVLVVASTDFSHYVPQEVAESHDSLAIEAICKMDEDALFNAISEKGISMCGYAGVASCLSACRALGAKKGEKLAYMTSGETGGDSEAVVGYGAIRIL
jgi:MEMO1 family protein